MELITTNAVKKWRATLGPTDSQEARNVAPESIRALFGKDKQSNAGHGSDSDISAIRVSSRLGITYWDYYNYYYYLLLITRFTIVV